MTKPTIADLDLIRSALSDQPGSLAEFEKHLGNDRDALGYALAANIGPIRLSAIEGPHPESPEWHAGYEAGREEAADGPNVFRDALARAITGGYADFSINADLYHNDPIYHAIVWEIRQARRWAASGEEEP